MSPQDDDRVWARADRAMAPPQRKYARRMRRQQPTEAERKLWWYLRHRLQLHGTHFRRQVQIGPYIVDFANHQVKLINEIDGGQHASQPADELRSQRLAAEGYGVLRFWNNEVLSNVDGVLTAIQAAITSTPTPDPSPQGGGE